MSLGKQKPPSLRDVWVQRVNRFLGRNEVARIMRTWCIHCPALGIHSFSCVIDQLDNVDVNANGLFCQCPRIFVQNRGHGEVNDSLEDAQYGAEDLDLVRVDEVAAELA